MSGYDATPSESANPYGAPGPTYGGGPGGGVEYAHWGKRVGAYLLDGLLVSVVGIPFFILFGVLVGTGSATTDQFGNQQVQPTGGALAYVVLVAGYVVMLGFVVWNLFIKQGRSGYTIGKGVLGIKLIGEASGRPIGGLMCFVRSLAHILDGLPCYLGYLWPLWDAKRQTFADKVCSTVVLDQPKS